MPLRPLKSGYLLGFTLAGLAASCGGGGAKTTASLPAPSVRPPPPDLAARLAAELATACPPAAPNDEAARQTCAERLAGLPVLRDTMAEPFLWGGQKEVGVYALDASHLTKFSPYAWRKMYLSTFMFDGTHRVEQVGDRTVVHVSCSFRNELDGGSYPYPFWHSEKKWRAYEVATELHFVIEDGRILAAMRTAEADANRPKHARAWDGKWTWGEGNVEPKNTLFQNLFSAANPHVPALEKAYRQLEEGMRPYNCTGCHVPNNPAGMNPLELLVYPNQALAARKAIIHELEENKMPPETATSDAGIADPKAREQLLTLARDFAAVADRALEAEGEPKR
jgi:hypothetical protein